jgi:polyhydroxyalkanoate synthesis regulator phasin
LQEADNKQQEKIKKLEETLEAEQKEIDELKGQI